MGPLPWLVCQYAPFPPSKVEKILKGSLDSIPSPSVKSQIIGGKVCLRCNGKILLGVVNRPGCQEAFCFQNFVYITQEFFAVLCQVIFPAKNLNFHWRWRWWHQIQAIFLNLFYFTASSMWNVNDSLPYEEKSNCVYKLRNCTCWWDSFRAEKITNFLCYIKLTRKTNTKRTFCGKNLV